MRLDPESVDLAHVARRLRELLGSPVGAVVGRTQMRDAVVRELGCSQLEGERIIDTMVSRGFLSQTQEPGDAIRWEIREG